MQWIDIKNLALSAVQGKPEYIDRLEQEFKEIEKQGANGYWVDMVTSKTKWDDNPVGLVLPWALGMTPIDPIVGVNKLYIADPSGKEMDAVVFIVDGKEVVCSKDTLVKTNRGFVRADDICATDTLIS